MNLLESTTIAGSNAVLLTGDDSKLDLARSQQDLLWSLRKKVNGSWQVPYKHLDHGWDGYRAPDTRLAVHLWNISMDPADRERALRGMDESRWTHIADTVGKGDQAHAGPWFHYIQGHFPEYPDRILEVNWHQHRERLARIRSDDSDPDGWDVHHWQNLNPVICEGLVQLTLGAPQHIYHGGLLHCPLRYYDADKKRPGLPDAVAALVEQVRLDGITLQLGNLDLVRGREVIVQAGGFGEHQFTHAQIEGNGSEEPVDSRWVKVTLEPGAGVRLHLGIKRYENIPSYETPWTQPISSLLRGRDVEGTRV